jgi:hypothetical protein
VTRSTAAAALGLALFLVLAATSAASTPTISYSIDGISGTNGWYRGSSHGDNVIVHWSVSLDATATSCLAAVPVAGPTAGTRQSCWAQNADGRATAVTRVIRIDATPPTLTVRASRPPDFHGWYNHPVTIRWTGTDALSGIAHCSSRTYRGPDSSAATITGDCVDRAGNGSARPVRLAYDAIPPVLRGVKELSTTDADVLSWRSTSPYDRIVVQRAIRGRKARTTVFDGSAGGFGFTDTTIHPATEYVYFVRSVDEAGNGSKVVTLASRLKILTIRKTPYVPIAAPNPILRWPRVGGAAYYNVQLYRGSKRIYSVWPTMHQVGLSTTWKWSGRSFHLSPGPYRWYVWAGFGPRKSARYRIIGSARFLMPRVAHKTKVSTSASR